jgi:hypothetical protein
MTCRKIIFLYVYQLLSIPIQFLFIFIDKLQKKKKTQTNHANKLFCFDLIFFLNILTHN